MNRNKWIVSGALIFLCGFFMRRLPMWTNLKVFLGCGLIFLCGFTFGHYYHRKYLDKRSKVILQNLNIVANELDTVAAYLNERDELIRKKWQAMVSDISHYQFDGKPSAKWTEMDDQYLSSWASAEKPTE